MARLNEPHVIGESIEALKRRFMRQNRELAKSNSELKIKVATLEADRAQLLSENITLRDQNNHFKQEQARDYTKRAIQHVGIVKDKLKVKVAELTELMSELENAQAKPPSKELAITNARRKSYKRSPTQIRNWKNSLCGPEVTGLAPIVEDKHFPRRTLSANDIQNILSDGMLMTDSPELGPPPVAHFETAEVSIYGASPAEPVVEEQDVVQTSEQDTSSPPPLFTNLETRRKRRTSALVRGSSDEIENTSEVQNIAKAPSPEPLLKTGAKRKFGIREEEDDSMRLSVPDNTSFSFSRKSGATTDKPISRQVKPLPERNISKVAERARNIIGEVKARKALGEKAVNTDPVVSPVKSRHVTGKPDRPDIHEKAKERQKQRQQEKVEVKIEKPATQSIEIPPATPAPTDMDLFSPTESVQSANQGTRDTPPPSELTSKTAENTRPSRRQRGQVSYAEPNLRDKMRRPGKELADAVITGKTTKGDSAEQENIDIPKWATLPVEPKKGLIEPTSPLQNKSSHMEEALPTTVMTDRRRKSSIQSNTTGETEPRSDVSRAALAALISSQRRLSRVQHVEKQKLDNHSSSEVLDTSSPESFEQKASASFKQSRRHSSMADMKMRKEVTIRTQPVDTKSNIEDASVGRAERMASRRRSMQL